MGQNAPLPQRDTHPAFMTYREVEQIIRGGVVGSGDTGIEMEALAVYLSKADIAQDGLLQKSLGHIAYKSVLVDIAGEELTVTLIDAQVDDVVVEDIRHGHARVIIRGGDDLIVGGVDRDIAVIALRLIRHHGIPFHQLAHKNRIGGATGEIERVGRTVALCQFDKVAILVAEPEEMLRLLLNHIPHLMLGPHAQGITHHLEIGGHTGGIGIEDGIAAHHQTDVLGLGIHPDALKQTLGLRIFGGSGNGLPGGSAPTSYHQPTAQDKRQDQGHINLRESLYRHVLIQNGRCLSARVPSGLSHW